MHREKLPSKQPTVLFVDDDERILRTLNIQFRPLCRVLVTPDPQQAIAWATEQTIHVVVSDQRMPDMPGTELLARMREVSPDTVRVLLTGYSDIDAAVGALNDGEIWRYLAKPWTAAGIQRTVRDAITVSQSLRDTGSATPGVGDATEILVIDQEPDAFNAVRTLIDASVPLHRATSLAEAVEVLGAHPVGIIITEVVVNGDDMTHLLRTLKQQHPDILSIVVTGMRDTGRLIKLINQAQVFRYLPKPVHTEVLAQGLASAAARRTSNQRLALVPSRMRVDDAETEIDRTLSQRIGSYLARLKSRPTSTGAS